MSAPLIAGILNDRHGFNFDADRVRETARTAASTIYEASNDDGAAVQVEIFDTPVAHGTQFDAIPTSGAFQPRGAGQLDDGRLYVLQEAPVGTPLANLIDQKRSNNEVFTAQETRDLLQQVAETVDAYNASGQADLLARSINPEHLLVQPAWSDVPVKLSLVGPSLETAAPEDNLHDFWNVVAELTGQPVDEEAATKHATAVGYLEHATQELTDNTSLIAAPVGPPLAASAPQNPDDAPVADVSPRPQDGYRKPPEPYPANVAPAPAPEKNRMNPWPWIIAVLALALVALLVAWWWTTNRGEQWSASEQQIAEAYPGIVGKRAGQAGWEGLKCESAAPDADQEAKVRCANEDLGVTVAKYTTQSERDDAVPGSEYATVLGSGECMIDDFEIPDAYPQAFAMAPRDKGQFLIIVNGTEAEAKRLDLPVCN